MTTSTATSSTRDAVDAARQLRNSLGCFATGVTIVTAPATEGPPVGLTVSSFSSVSLDPPLVLFSVARSARSLEQLEDADGYAVNVLSSLHVELSNRFARAGEDKWDGVEYSAGHCDAPIFDDALATFECEPYATYDGGDHVIFVGRVVRHDAAEEREPLLFYRGRYHSVVEHAT